MVTCACYIAALSFAVHTVHALVWELRVKLWSWSVRVEFVVAASRSVDGPWVLAMVWAMPLLFLCMYCCVWPDVMDSRVGWAGRGRTKGRGTLYVPYSYTYTLQTESEIDRHK